MASPDLISATAKVFSPSYYHHITVILVRRNMAQVHYQSTYHSIYHSIYHRIYYNSNYYAYGTLPESYYHVETYFDRRPSSLNTT